MDINFNSLTRLNNPNSRVSYDLRWSRKTGKFTVSDSAYDRLNLNDNGFDVFTDAEGNVVFMIVPNQNAALYSGQEGSQKSNTFSASRLVDALSLENTTTWKMNTIEHEGETYVTLEVMEVKTPEEDDQEETTVEAEVQEEPASDFSI